MLTRGPGPAARGAPPRRRGERIRVRRNQRPRRRRGGAAIAPREAAEGPGPQVLVVSARTPEALRDAGRRTADGSAPTGAGEPLADVCITAWAAGRDTSTDWPWPGVRAELGGASPGAAQGVAGPGIRAAARGRAAAGPRVRLHGTGTQWAGMGRSSCAGDPVVREAFGACEAAIRSTRLVLAGGARPPGGASRLCSTEIAQPAVFAVQVAVAAWWRSRGVVPEAVVGHSMGEVAAAHVAGALSLEEAARIIVHRARLMEPTRGQGPDDRGGADLGPGGGARAGARGSVAAVNSPTLVRAVGRAPGPEEAAAASSARTWSALAARRVRVPQRPDGAGAGQLAERLGTLERLPPDPHGLHGDGGLGARGRLDAAYWARNMREPVRFREAVDTLGAPGIARSWRSGPIPRWCGPFGSAPPPGRTGQ